VTSDVAAVIGGPVGLLRYHLERQGITIEERHEPMPKADLDPASIQQVVINIISDMAAAMPRGGRLTISTGPAGDHARIAVEADAPEVDLEALKAAFQPFDDDPGEIPGSRRIAASLGVVRGHDATIGLRHEPGQRPRVEIHLPHRAAPVVD
jgi:signal transduction histidine kinase